MDKVVSINSPPKLMGIKPCSAYLGMSEYALRKGIRNGTIPYFRSGSKYYIAVDVLLERLKERPEPVSSVTE